MLDIVRDCDQRQRPATAHNTRTIRRDLGYVRPEKQTIGISAVPPRQLPAESSVAGIGRLLRITPGAPPEYSIGRKAFPSGSRPRLAVVLEDDPVACSFVSTRDYAGCAVLALRGDLDISDRAELSSRLAAVASYGPWVIVDLTNLAYMDCGSLGVLAAVRERAQLAGGDVLLAGPRGAVAWMLLTGRAGEFSVFPSVGVAAFGAGLAAIATRMATDGAGKSLAAATEKMVTAAGTVTAP